MSRKTTLASRLRQLHAMLGSNNAQERETARVKIIELLARHRKSWNDLTELMSAGGADLDPSWSVARKISRPPTMRSVRACQEKPKSRPTCSNSCVSSSNSSST